MVHLDQYILVLMEYDTKRVKAKALQMNTVCITIKNIFDLVITCFEHPLEFMFNQGGNFVNDVIQTLMTLFVITVG